MSAFNTLKPRKNGHQFPDDNFECICLNENLRFIFLTYAVIVCEVCSWEKGHTYKTRALQHVSSIKFLASAFNFHCHYPKSWLVRQHETSARFLFFVSPFYFSPWYDLLRRCLDSVSNKGISHQLFIHRPCFHFPSRQVGSGDTVYADTMSSHGARVMDLSYHCKAENIS